jgi:hypothetical protein
MWLLGKNRIPISMEVESSDGPIPTVEKKILLGLV